MIAKPSRVTRMIWKGTNEQRGQKNKKHSICCSISQERSETHWVERLIRSWSAFLSSNYALRERSLRLMTSVRLPFGVCSCNHRLSLRTDAPWSRPLPTVWSLQCSSSCCCYCSASSSSRSFRIRCFFSLFVLTLAAASSGTVLVKVFIQWWELLIKSSTTIAVTESLMLLCTNNNNETWKNTSCKQLLPAWYNPSNFALDVGVFPPKVFPK